MRQVAARVLGTAVVLAAALLSPVGVMPAGATSGPGYRLQAGDGGIFDFGDAQFLGSATGRCTSLQCWGFATTADGSGYWVLDNLPRPGPTTSGLYGFGTAPDVAGLAPGATAAAASPGGDGGWVLYGTSGKVVPFGGAASYGDATSLNLSEVTVPPYGTLWYFQGIVATPDGGGYWLVGEDGGVFAYGDAPFYGSMGGKPLNAPVAGIARTNDGRGYWLVAYDGGVFSFGDAGFYGSMGGQRLNDLMTSIAANPDGSGYWTAALDGGVFAFGDAPFLGSMGGRSLARPVYNIAATG